MENRFVAVSDGRNFRFTSSKTDIVLRANLIDGLTRLNAFGDPSQFASFMGEPVQIASGKSPMPMLCAPIAVSLMAEFLGRDIPGLRFDDLPFVQTTHDQSNGFDKLSWSQVLTDVFDKTLDSRYGREMLFDPTDHLPRRASTRSWYWKRGQPTPTDTDDVISRTLLNPSFNPSLFSIDSSRRTKFDLSEFLPMEFTPTDLPSTLEGKQFSLKDLYGKVVLIELHDKHSGPGTMTPVRMRAAYDSFHKKGLEIFGMSLDIDRADAKLEGAGLPWAQLFDGKGWSNPLIARLGITALPCYIVIQRGGRASVVPATDDPTLYIQGDLKNYPLDYKGDY